MREKFDPSAVDKNAVDQKSAVVADMTRTDLDEGLDESFPASDPVSLTLPKPSSD